VPVGRSGDGAPAQPRDSCTEVTYDARTVGDPGRGRKLELAKQLGKVSVGGDKELNPAKTLTARSDSARQSSPKATSVKASRFPGRARSWSTERKTSHLCFATHLSVGCVGCRTQVWNLTCSGALSLVRLDFRLHYLWLQRNDSLMSATDAHCQNTQRIPWL